MKELDLIGRIATAIQNANINHPRASDGTIRDQHVRSNEESLFLARIALIAIRDAGCIVGVEED